MSDEGHLDSEGGRRSPDRDGLLLRLLLLRARIVTYPGPRRPRGGAPRFSLSPRLPFYLRMTITSTSASIPLHQLVYLDEGEHVVVGRRDIDSYGFFPPDGAELLRALERGLDVDAAKRWYEETFGEGVDIQAFVDGITELGFVRQANEGTTANPVRGQRLGRVLFSPAAWVIYAAIIAAAVVVALTSPGVRPSVHHVLFCGSLIAVELTVFVGQTLLALVHETFHVLAGRRLGLKSRVRISRRFYYFVYETVLDGLVTVPRRARYLPILAGLLADVLCIALLILCAFAAYGGGPDPALCARVALALAVTTIPRIVWQFYFYLGTDVYHLISNALGCGDLQGAARHLVRNRFGRLRGRPGLGAAEAAFSARDLRLARWYAPLMAVGYLFSALTIVLLVAPLAWQFGTRLLDALDGSGASHGTHFWDAALVLTLTLLQLAVAAWVFIRDRRQATTNRG